MPNFVKMNRQNLPENILAILPLTLFFPIGVMYFGIIVFILSLLFAGNYQEKWQCIKSHVLTIPIFALSLVTCFAAIFLAHPPHEFWPGFFHYQTYLFFLLFICVGAGDWQRQATQFFYIGAIMAATLFYLNMAHLLPARTPFTSYAIYSGNKSILLGILLGIAAGWMLFDLTIKNTQRWWRLAVLAALVYVLLALFFLAKTRTGNLIFVICALVVVYRHLRFSWRSVLLLLGLCVALAMVWESADTLRSRLISMVHDVQAFSQGEKVSSEGIRLEMYQITAQMIAEKPVTGHGISTWISEYQSRAKGLITETMTTPHNDYLLYATEIGLIGLAALLWIWLKQLAVARKLVTHSSGQHVKQGIQLAMLTLAMITGGMFNAILRDALFGLAFMILLAIPLAGIQRRNGKCNEI